MDPHIRTCMDVFRKQDAIISTVVYKCMYTNKIISAFHIIIIIKDTYRDTYKSSINTYKVTQTKQNVLIIK